MTTESKKKGGRRPARKFKNRIVGAGEENPEQLLANPDNWRVHPSEQQDLLAGVLTEVGWIDDVVVNRTTERIIDGHLRVMLAMRAGEKKIPVKYVELTEAEERVILATFDKITEMAVTDPIMLSNLMSDIDLDKLKVPELATWFTDTIATLNAAAEDTGDAGGGEPEPIAETFDVLVVCDNEDDQRQLIDELIERGMECRALTS